METKLDKEKIQALNLYKQLEKEHGESTLNSLADELMRYWDTYEKHANLYANKIKYCLDSELIYARNAFLDIQRKKLFNLECNWRAGKIKLDIVCSHTFRYYYKLIHECPFLEPVTEEELAAYKEYLFELDGYPEPYISFLDHEELVMEALQNSNKYPQWYKFYDNKFNTKKLLLLNDLVNENELRCYHEHFKQFRTSSQKDFKKSAEEFQAIMNAFATGDYSNIVVTTHEKFLELARILNDKKYVSQLNTMIDHKETAPGHFLELAYYYLDGILYDIPPIKKDYKDWQDAIYYTASEYLRMQVIKLLDNVYEDYKAGKLNNYTDVEREKAKKDLDFWENAYLDGKKKLDKG